MAYKLKHNCSWPSSQSLNLQFLINLGGRLSRLLWYLKRRRWLGSQQVGEHQAQTVTASCAGAMRHNQFLPLVAL